MEPTKKVMQSASSENSAKDGQKLQRREMALYVWSRMAGMYGHRWTSQFGESPMNEDGSLTLAAQTWGDGLRDCSREDVNRGFATALVAVTNDGWAPTLPLFLLWCKPHKHPETYAPKLKKIESDEARERAAKHVSEILQKLGI